MVTEYLKFISLCLCIFFLVSCGRPQHYPPVVRSLPTPPSREGSFETAIPSTQRPYIVNNKAYYPLPSAHGYQERGIASWYGKKFHGRKTACGERYNMYAKTAAHKTLPMNTMLLVTNLENGKETVVRINDRGPFVKGRIIDLTLTSARELDIVSEGTARVKITALGEAITYKKNNQQIGHFLAHNDFATGEFYIQIGSFASHVNAENLKRKMIDMGRNALVQVYDNGYATYYRVHVYAGITLSAARQQEIILEEAGYPGFVVAR